MDLNLDFLNVKSVIKVTKGGTKMSVQAVVAMYDDNHNFAVVVDKGKYLKVIQDRLINVGHKYLQDTNVNGSGSVFKDYKRKFKNITMIVKRAPEGKGILAPNCLRSILSGAGIKNIVIKVIGKNKQVCNMTKLLCDILYMNKKYSDSNIHRIRKHVK